MEEHNTNSVLVTVNSRCWGLWTIQDNQDTISFKCLENHKQNSIYLRCIQMEVL